MSKEANTWMEMMSKLFQSIYGGIADMDTREDSKQNAQDNTLDDSDGPELSTGLNSTLPNNLLGANALNNLETNLSASEELLSKNKNEEDEEEDEEEEQENKQRKKFKI